MVECNFGGIRAKLEKKNHALDNNVIFYSQHPFYNANQITRINFLITELFSKEIH